MSSILQKLTKMTDNKSHPLSHLLRPQSFAEIVGQDHLFGKFGALKLIEQSKNVPSMILWGPAGVGKTTIAKILAHITDADFVMISAVESNMAEIRKIIEEIRVKNNRQDLLTQSDKKTILMVDEIHHFNKTQQDLFLPFIEDGTIILVGTTTENPSFALNSAILSRSKVLTLNSLETAALEKLLMRAEEYMNKKLPLDDEARQSLISLACGDARYLLNACEELFYFGKEDDKNINGDGTNDTRIVRTKVETGRSESRPTRAKSVSEKILTRDELLTLVTKRSAHFDKKGEFHFNLISAFHKSLRGSDVDAALYYLARMLVAGEDPYYILRRLARFATEDIGIADPNALLQIMACKENYDFLGSPEGDYALSHAVIYLATAPKSNASYVAHKAAMEVAKSSTQLSPPKHILNAPTKMMKEQGYNKGYIYDHDTPDCFSGQEYFPDELLKKQRPQFYEPNERGFERDVKKRMEYWQHLRQKIKNDFDGGR